jgi:phage/plasmid-like protein (TIGR03299 family)
MEILDIPTEGRQLAWAGITTGSAGSDLVSSEQLLHSAGLDWEVAKRPLLRTNLDGEIVQSEKSYEIYRTDTGEELGTVKAKYQVWQNRDAFAFGDALVADGKARWVDAGRQGNGWRVFMTMQLTDPFQVADDRFDLYLFLRTSHDGSSSVSGYVTPIRVWCTNQLPLVSVTALDRFSFQHTNRLSERMAEAQQSFQQTVEFEKQFKASMEQLLKTGVSDDKARYLIKDVIPDARPRKADMVDAIMLNYQTSPTVAPYLGTGYGLLNGLTEYMDHVKTQRNGNARFESVMHGEGAKFRFGLTKRLLTLS